ncbi:hypothetical protein L9F63_022456, partial [Diploptera punctata]
VLLLLSLVAVATCVPIYEEHKEIEVHHYAEKRDGDKVEGYYKLVEPDGTTRTVHYTADKHTGFHAQVTKSGHAVHPTYEKKIVLPVKQVVIPIKYEELATPLYSHGSASSFTSFGHLF